MPCPPAPPKAPPRCHSRGVSWARRHNLEDEPQAQWSARSGRYAAVCVCAPHRLQGTSQLSRRTGCLRSPSRAPWCVIVSQASGLDVRCSTVPIEAVLVHRGSWRVGLGSVSAAIGRVTWR